MLKTKNVLTSKLWLDNKTAFSDNKQFWGNAILAFEPAKVIQEYTDETMTIEVDIE